MSSSPIPLKTRRLKQQCPLNLSRADMSSRWCGVVVRRGCQLKCHPRHLTMVQNDVDVAKSPRVAEQCDVNIPSLIHYKHRYFDLLVTGHACYYLRHFRQGRDTNFKSASTLRFTEVSDVTYTLAIPASRGGGKA
ncbi:uncharacterized protein TNCV_3251931 [Trichonephila clavipes]|nr:uncharacterized protein TNCV_3251931 [Trichonephila clavipes]